MDPVSVIGLAGSVVGIVDVLAKSVNFLLNLQTKYKQADLTISLLIGQLSTLKAALNQISEWITSSLIAVPQHEQLVLDLTISIEGCKILVSALDDRINSFERNAAHTLNPLGKAQLLWEEKGTTDYLNYLSNQISALNLLLTALQCRSLFEQTNLLQSDESRRIVDMVEDDKSSLLWLRDDNSYHSRLSVSTENSQLLDTRFDFDREIFNSKAYQVAIRSNMRQALSNKTDTRLRRQTFPLRPLANAFNHPQLDDSEDAKTVREERLGSLSSEGHVQLGDNNDAQTVREERSSPLSSSDELLGEPIEELRSSVSSMPIDGIWVRNDLDVISGPVCSPLHYNLPINNGVTDHHPERSVNPAIQSPTPGPKYNIFAKLRDSLASPTSLNGEDIRAVSTTRVARQKFSFLLNGRNLRKIRKEGQSNAKVLILGASQSGKSVLLDSMKLSVDGYNAYSHDFRERFKEVIFTDMIHAMRMILAEMEFRYIFLEDQENEHHVEAIRDARITCDSVDPDVAVAIRALWSDGGVQKYFEGFEMRQRIKSCSYYFDSISRIALTDYVPTNEDILRSWVKTTGITETVFQLESLTYRVFDVGGTRSERKKWIHVFENVAVNIFLVDVSEYDQHLHEDPSENRMGESLTLFDSICNLRWFLNASTVLFFTKIDCLKSKLATSPINNYFADFSGDPTNLEDVKDYIAKRFLSLNKNPKKKIDVYFTSIVSETSPGRTAFAAIEKALHLREEKQWEQGEKDIGHLEVNEVFASQGGSFFF